MSREPNCRSWQRLDAQFGAIAVTFERLNMSHDPVIVKPLNEPPWAHGSVDCTHESTLEVAQLKSFLLLSKRASTLHLGGA